MSYDVQFLSLVDDFPISDQKEVPGSSPRAVRVFCTGNIRYTKTVEINGIKTGNFVVETDFTLLVYPDSQFDDTPADQLSISVLSSKWTSGQRVRLVFSPGLTITRVEGTQKLIQQLVKSILSESGSNAFNRGEGGNVLSALGITLNADAKAHIAAIFSEAASRVQRSFVTAQTGKKIPASERLLSFKLNRVSFDSDAQKAVAYLRVVTYDGVNTSIPLVL